VDRAIQAILGENPDPQSFVAEMATAFMELVNELRGLEGDVPVHENACAGGCDFLASDASEFCCKKCEWGQGHGKHCEGCLPPPGRLILVITFPYAPVVLSKNFMHDDEYFAAHPPCYDMTPRAERHAMWIDFVAEMRRCVESCNSRSVMLLDVTPVFEEQGTTDAEFRTAFMKEKTGKEGGWNGWTDNWLEDNHPDFIKTQGHVARCIAALQIPGVAPAPPLTELYPTERRHLAKPFW